MWTEAPFWRYLKGFATALGALMTAIGSITLKQNIQDWGDFLGSFSLPTEYPVQFTLIGVGVVLMLPTIIPWIVRLKQRLWGGTSGNDALEYVIQPTHGLRTLDHQPGSPTLHESKVILILSNDSSQGDQATRCPNISVNITYCDEDGSEVGGPVRGAWLRSTFEGNEYLADENIDLAPGQHESLLLAVVSRVNEITWINRESIRFRNWENPAHVMEDTSGKVFLDFEGDNVRFRVPIIVAQDQNHEWPWLRAEVFEVESLQRRSALLKRLMNWGAWRNPGELANDLERLTEKIGETLLALYASERGTVARGDALKRAEVVRASFRERLNGSQSQLEEDACEIANSFLITLNGVISNFRAANNKADSFEARQYEAEARRLGSVLGDHQGDTGKLREFINALRRSRGRR